MWQILSFGAVGLVGLLSRCLYRVLISHAALFRGLLGVRGSRRARQAHWQAQQDSRLGY
jgi:hypothetical protein